MIVKVNLSIVVSMRWRSGGSATLMPVRNPVTQVVQTSASRDSEEGEAAQRWSFVGLRNASALFASSPRLRP